MLTRFYGGRKGVYLIANRAAMEDFLHIFYPEKQERLRKGFVRWNQCDQKLREVCLLVHFWPEETGKNKKGVCQTKLIWSQTETERGLLTHFGSTNKKDNERNLIESRESRILLNKTYENCATKGYHLRPILQFFFYYVQWYEVDIRGLFESKIV